MPRDFLASVGPPSRRRFRRTVVVISSLGHLVALSVILVAQVLAVGPLPEPRHARGFDWIPARLTDIELPPTAPSHRPPVRVETSAPPNAAPLEPPTGITKESGFESVSRATPPGEIVGIEQGGADLLVEVGRPSAPPAPVVQQPQRLHSGIKPPSKIQDSRPDYPPLARSARVEGIVIIEATIDVSGNVQDARVLRSIPMLDQAAVDAVRQWRYTPALLNGVPVPVIITVTVNFRLQ